MYHVLRLACLINCSLATVTEDSKEKVTTVTATPNQQPVVVNIYNNNNNTANANPRIISNNQNINTGNESNKFRDMKTLAERLYELPYIVRNKKKFVPMNGNLAVAIFPRDEVTVTNTDTSANVTGVGYGGRYSRMHLGHAVVNQNQRQTSRVYDGNEQRRYKLHQFIKNLLEIRKTDMADWDLQQYEQQMRILKNLDYLDNFWTITNCFVSVIYLLLSEESFYIHLDKKTNKNNSSQWIQNSKIAYLITNLLANLIILFVYPSRSFYEKSFSYYGYWLLALGPIISTGICYGLAQEEKDTKQNNVMIIVGLAIAQIISFLCFIANYAYLTGLPRKYNLLMNKICHLEIFYHTQDRLIEPYIWIEQVEELQALSDGRI